MGYIKTIFLGKEYSIPQDVLTYIDLLDFTESVKTQLVNAFIRKLNSEIQKGNTARLDDKDLSAEIETQVGRFIAKLCDNGIFNRTISDYLRNNKGYQLYSDVNKAALEKMKSLLIREMDSWQAGFEDAMQKKESSVTGMGFSIWSSSFVNHAIYAAMEASTVDKQEKAAAVQYQKDMSDLRARLDSQYGKEKSAYVHNTYIPHMEAALTVFAYELLDKYVADLIANGKFDAKTLDFVDISRSNDLLKNLTLSNNKKAILENAFVACPYNIAVYEQATRYELLDYASFQTTKVFKQHQPILLLLKKSLGDVEYPGKFKLNYGAAKKLAEFTQCDVISILQAKTATYVDSVIKAYGNVVGILDNRKYAARIMSELSETAILSGNTASKGKASAYITGIISQNVWAELTERCGYTDLLDRIKTRIPGSESIATKHDIDLLLEEKLYPILEEARQVRENEIIKHREAEAKQRAADAENARRTAARNKLFKKLCIVAAIVVIIIVIASTIITKTTNAKAYQNMAGEFCVYRVINDDGEERDEFNWWLSVDEDGTMQMSSWSYAIDNCEVDSYSGSLKNKANFQSFEDYRIEDYCADVSEYEEALYCYEFHIADQWDEFDGYIVCWQYHSGKIVDVYCDDYRYSFVEISDDYSFNKWEDEINSDKLSNNVQKLIDNIDVSEEDIIEGIETHISAGEYDDAVALIATSKLSDEQKNAYYESLVSNIDFKSCDVNGLVLHIPEQWDIREKDNGNIMDAISSNDGAYACFWVEYEGTSEEVEDYGKQDWITRNKLSKTTIPGCTSAYVRYKTDDHGKYGNHYVIEHYVECDGRIFQLQYSAYGDRYFEEEVWMLLERVEFTSYADSLAAYQEQKYLKAVDLFNNGKYSEALSVFETITGYKDSENKITECTTAIAGNEYANAVALINEGDYVAAYDILIKLNTYPDAASMLQNFKWVPTESTYVPTKSSESNSYHTYTYNDEGVLVKEVINDSTVVMYSYDSYGNLVSKEFTYSNGDTLEYEYIYNANHQLTQERMTDRVGDVSVVNYKYDSTGRIIEAEDLNGGYSDSIITYYYDTAGKLEKKDTVDGWGSLGCYEYEYDENGLLIKEIHTTDIGESYSVVYTTEYSYSDEGLLTAIYEYKDAKKTGYEYFSNWIVFYSPTGFLN